MRRTCCESQGGNGWFRHGLKLELATKCRIYTHFHAETDFSWRWDEEWGMWYLIILIKPMRPYFMHPFFWWIAPQTSNVVVCMLWDFPLLIQEEASFTPQSAHFCSLLLFNSGKKHGWGSMSGPGNLRSHGLWVIFISTVSKAARDFVNHSISHRIHVWYIC